MVVETTCLLAAMRASTISFDRFGENRQSLVNETTRNFDWAVFKQEISSSLNSRAGSK